METPPRDYGQGESEAAADNFMANGVEMEHFGDLDYRALIREQRRELEELRRAALEASPR